MEVKKRNAVAADTVKAYGGLEVQLQSPVNLTNTAPMPNIPGTVSVFQGNTTVLGDKRYYVQ